MLEWAYRSATATASGIQGTTQASDAT
jgi:hypothetical protein